MGGVSCSIIGPWEYLDWQFGVFSWLVSGGGIAVSRCRFMAVLLRWLSGVVVIVSLGFLGVGGVSSWGGTGLSVPLFWGGIKLGLCRFSWVGYLGVGIGLLVILLFWGGIRLGLL